MSRGIYWRHP